MRLRLLPFLLVLLISATFESRATAQSPAAAPDLKQNIANLSSLDFPVRMQAARLIRRTMETEAVPALREAARALMKQERSRHPFHWAPFILVGDWR